MSTTPPTTGDDRICAVATDTPIGGSMTILVMQVGVATFAPTFDATADYEGYGASLCRDEVTGRVTWIFEANGEPLGQLEMSVATTGNIDLQSATDEFRWEIYGDTGPEVDVTNRDFVSGAWVVDALTPTLQSTIQGDTLAGAEYLLVNVAVSADTQ